MKFHEDKSSLSTAAPPSPGRRTFLERAALTAVGLSTLGTANITAQEIESLGAERSVGGRRRERQAYRIRVEAAQHERDRPLVDHPTNGDEERYPNKIA
ncbi:MAG: hypothetical protein L0312_18895, partial [Acidobacteria bacterium]|nr:hypothetical protein [Acidobacteriota bacterium]